MSKFHSVSIKKIKRETKDAVSILFDIPDSLQTDFNFIAGQYITIKTLINKEEVRRAYSICSSDKSNALRVAVKRVKNGHFSVYATTKLKEGDVIEITVPEGKFVLNTNASNTNSYLAFAAGSGITPIMSMIKSVLESEPNSNFVLVYGNKSTYETIFFDEINSLLNSFGNRFFVQYVFSKEQPKDSLFGRIDASVVNYVLKQHANLVFNSVFLCGPEEMIQTTKETLLKNDFKEETIHFELFTTSKKETITDQVAFDGKTSITVLLDDETTTFTMDAKHTILDASLKENLDAPYSCQGGICSSCLAKITHGKATMIQNSILSEDEIADGLILTCQAHPTTAKITVDFDDL